MNVSTRTVQLDDTGAGSVTVQPAFYCGASDSALTVEDEQGNALGATPLTRGTAKVVAGKVSVSGGTPNTEAVLFFNFD